MIQEFINFGKSNTCNLLIQILTVLVAALAVLMGLAGPSTKILFCAWLVVPSPVILIVTYGANFPYYVTVAARTYIYLSMVMAMLLLMAVAWSGSETALHPEVNEDMEELHDYPDLGKNVESVAFIAQDGTILRGWLALGDTEKAVVLLHGYTGNRRQMLKEANMLYQAGMTVLLFDFRHIGESDGEFVSFGYYEKQDVLAAINFLESLNGEIRQLEGIGITSIGLLGRSMGGATAILFAAENPGRVDALVVDSTFKSLDSAIAQSFTHFVGLPAFPFAPITVWITERKTGLKRQQVIPEQSVVALQGVPILVIHGLDDETISIQDSESIYKAAKQPKELWLVPGAAHGKASEVAETEYRDLVVDFFKHNLHE